MVMFAQTARRKGYRGNGKGPPKGSTKRRGRGKRRGKSHQETKKWKFYANRNGVLKIMGFQSYRDYLKSPLWRGIRERVLKRDPNCHCCGRPSQQAHHRSYSLQVLQGEYIAPIIGVCCWCHKVIENTKEGRKATDPDELDSRIGRLIQWWKDKRKST